MSAELRCPATVDPERVIQVIDEATLLCPNILENPASSVALTRLGRRWNRYTTARARTHCVVYQLRREAIAGLLETNAEVAAALEKSVRRGLELVNRRVAATATGDVGVGGQLLQRIRRFFRSDAG